MQERAISLSVAPQSSTAWVMNSTRIGVSSRARGKERSRSEADTVIFDRFAHELLQRQAAARVALSL